MPICVIQPSTKPSRLHKIRTQRTGGWLVLLTLTKRCRWFEFITPSTLALQPLLELLLQPAASEHREMLQLGLQEALVNAVRHGNGNDPAKLVRIRRIHSPQWLIWQVQDQGPGLQHDQRLASLPDELDAISGRGLFLMHQCFDDVRWSQRGNRVQLAKRR